MGIVSSKDLERKVNKMDIRICLFTLIAGLGMASALPYDYDYDDEPYSRRPRYDDDYMPPRRPARRGRYRSGKPSWPPYDKNIATTVCDNETSPPESPCYKVGDGR